MRETKVLLVEDKESDARLIKEAFKEASGIDYRIDVISDGQEAIDYLQKVEKDKDFDFPDIIILDIKLPKKNGIEILKEIKSSVSLKEIPVVMLTNSDVKNDIMNSYEHQANSYITKPLAMKDLVETIKYVEKTWILK